MSYKTPFTPVILFTSSTVLSTFIYFIHSKDAQFAFLSESFEHPVSNKKERLHNKIVTNNLIFLIIFSCKLIIHYLQKNMNSIAHIFLHYIFTSHNIFYISK